VFAGCEVRAAAKCKDAGCDAGLHASGLVGSVVLRFERGGRGLEKCFVR